MVTYLPRSEWKARPPNGGPGSLTVSRVQGAVIHWPGSASKTPITSKTAVASALRGWQAYHMDVKGWSDIAYQVAVDQAGRVWTLRGLRTQSGANGNNELNEEYGAILLVLIAGEQPSAAMEASVRGVIADFRKIYPKGTAIKPHSAVRPDGTDCPGAAARAAIARGDFTPGVVPTPPPPPTEEIDVAAKDEILDYLEACTIQIQNHNDQVLRAAVLAIQNNIDAVDEEVWRSQVKKFSTADPEDTEAMSSATVYGADRAADKVLEQLQPQLDSLKAAVEALSASLPKA